VYYVVWEKGLISLQLKEKVNYYEVAGEEQGGRERGKG
jgi:hypothetical protein